LSFLLFVVSSCKKDFISNAQVRELTLASTFTNSTYQIWVVLPEKYTPNAKYETIYLLDGDANYLRSEKIATLSAKYSSKYNKQNLLVVGISSANNRSRDFTPTITPYGEGGCENYVKFIKQELIPKIESDYAVDTTSNSRLLIGHSLGGLLAGYIFNRHSEVFNSYLMLSPSFWYDNSFFFNDENIARANNSSKKCFVFIGCGEFEESTVIGAKEWKYRLSTYYPNSLSFYQLLKNRSHLSSAFENAEIGIEYYFKYK
jgi:predicted alpha/beta superfamily hydrolase